MSSIGPIDFICPLISFVVRLSDDYLLYHCGFWIECESQIATATIGRVPQSTSLDARAHVSGHRLSNYFNFW